MKRFSLILIVLCSAWLASCNKEDETGGTEDNNTFSVMDGSIVINNHPDVKITSLNEFPVGVSTEAGISASRKSVGIKSMGVGEAGDDLRGNDYRFKLVAQMSTLKINRDGEADVEVQATHVKVIDGYAFVSYNEKGDPHRGGVVVYKYVVNDGSLENVSVNVTAVSSIEMKNAEVSAIDFYEGKLYLTGASSEPQFGYNANNDGYNYAFYMAVGLNADKSFKKDTPEKIQKLTSFQGTSIRVLNDRIYVTTGDGTNGTEGGLYIFNATDYSSVKSILNKDHARSVDVDASNIFLMQAEPARITKYSLNGDGGTVIYQTTDESMQQYAKSEILAWDKYLFVAENESGLRMLKKEDGALNASLDRPGENPETEVTNSVAMNSDLKKNYGGKDVQSNLLFLANGEKGIYWYDVMKDSNGKDWVVPCKDNSVLGGTGSANFIASKGNIVFVADGLGGLKVLYIGFDNGITPPPVAQACDAFMPYLFNAGSSAESLLPESQSVFRSSANPIIKTLFSDPANVPNYIEVVNNTELYISYLGEWAGWHNALGYFVIPASVEKTTEAEVAYYNSSIKQNLCKSGTNILKDEYTIFKNVTDVSEGGPLKAPNTYQIGTGKFNKGDRVVLFMVPDGWSSQNSNVEMSFIGYNQVFFSHKGINLATNIPYDNSFGTFKGVQYNTFYSADCKSVVMFFEDKHSYTGVDTDYNDVIFSVSDNIEQKEIASIVPPKYSIVTTSGKPELVESSTLFNK